MEDLVLSTVATVLRNGTKELPITLDTRLSDLGFDSLDYAETVILLEKAMRRELRDLPSSGIICVSDFLKLEFQDD